MPSRAGAPDDGATEQRILEAAHTVFLRAGTAGARMQEIADEAGVNKALLHYYFRSKDRLAQAVFERAARQLFPRVLQVLASDATIEDKVHQVVGHYLDQLSRLPYLAGYVLSELNQHPERITQAFHSGPAAGEPVAGQDRRGGGGAQGREHLLRRRARAKLEAQLRERIDGGTLRPVTVEEFLVNLMALCIFPFAARPMMEAMLGMTETGFRRFITRRRNDLPEFFLRALQP